MNKRFLGVIVAILGCYGTPVLAGDASVQGLSAGVAFYVSKPLGGRKTAPEFGLMLERTGVGVSGAQRSYSVAAVRLSSRLRRDEQGVGFGSGRGSVKERPGLMWGIIGAAVAAAIAANDDDESSGGYCATCNQ